MSRVAPPADIDNAAEPADETTGFPGLRTWRGVYLLVVAVFVVYVAALLALSWRFS